MKVLQLTEAASKITVYVNADHIVRFEDEEAHNQQCANVLFTDGKNKTFLQSSERLAEMMGFGKL